MFKPAWEASKGVGEGGAKLREGKWGVGRREGGWGVGRREGGWGGRISFFHFAFPSPCPFPFLRPPPRLGSLVYTGAQEPITRIVQLPCAHVTAISRTSLLLERFWREF